MMKRLSILSALFVLYTGSMFAYLHPVVQYGQNWGFGAEFLYWLPSVDDTFFVITGANAAGNPQGKRENNDFRFRPGFRVEGVYSFACNREFHVRYARLSTKQNKTISGASLFATHASPVLLEDNFEDFAGEAGSSLNVLYQNVEAIFVQQAWECCPFDLYLFAGVQYAYIRLNEHINYTSSAGPFANVDDKSRTWGVGPQFGVEFYYPICQLSTCFCPGNLSLAALTSGSLLASKIDSKSFQTLTGETIVDVNNDRTWRIVPTWNARLGLNYATCFSCFGAFLEVGYEFTTYLRALSRIEFEDASAGGLTFDNYHNFDAHGLYVAVGFTF